MGETNSGRASRKAAQKAANVEANKIEGIFGDTKTMLIVIGVALAFVGFAAVQFVALLSGNLTPGMSSEGSWFGFGGANHILNVNDHSADNINHMKDVFYSGKPYVLYCVNEQGENAPMPTVVREIGRLMKNEYPESRLLIANCFANLPTGDTIASRFHFGKNPNFLAVFGGPNSERPAQLNYLSSASQVVSNQIYPVWARGGANNVIKPVIYLTDFAAFKKAHKSIVLLGDVTKRAMMQKAMGEGLKSRNLSAYQIDNTFYTLNLEKEFTELAPMKEDANAVCFVRDHNPELIDAFGIEIPEKREDGNFESTKKTSYTAMYLNSWEEDDVEKFLNKCQNGIQYRSSAIKLENSYDSTEADDKDSEDKDKPVAEPLAFYELTKKPRLSAIESEVKKVQAPKRARKSSTTEEGDEDLEEGEDEENEAEEIVTEEEAGEVPEEIEEEVEL